MCTDAFQVKAVGFARTIDSDLLDMSEAQTHRRCASNRGRLIIKSVNEQSAGFSDVYEHQSCQKNEPYHWWLSA